MNKALKKIEDSIKRKHSFSWTPKFKAETSTNLKKIVFVPIVIETFKNLGWDLIYQDETSAEAKRKGNWNKWTEKISVSWDYGKVTVKSVSLGNEMWDNGRNSKRVELFIYAFNKTVATYDSEALAELEEKTEKANNWDDYEIPDVLPLPSKTKQPIFWIPVVAGIITSLLVGFVIGFLSVKRGNIIGLFEIGVGFAFGFALKQFIKLSNYTKYDKLHYLLMAMVVIAFVSNQYFQYRLILADEAFNSINFWQFMQLRFTSGLTIQGLNTGWIGLVISWGLWLVLAYFIGMLRLSVGLTSYQISRIPMEVVDFAYFHFVKNKTEDQVRLELTKKGWSNKQNQDEVFESLGAFTTATELNRIE